MNGKGSAQRPRQVSKREFDRRWRRAFRDSDTQAAINKAWGGLGEYRYDAQELPMARVSRK